MAEENMMQKILKDEIINGKLIAEGIASNMKEKPSENKVMDWAIALGVALFQERNNRWRAKSSNFTEKSSGY